MQPNALEIKKLRNSILSLRDSLRDRDIISKKIISNLFSLDCFKNSKTIMLFVSFRSEVNTHPLIKELLSKKEKNVVLPVSDIQNKQLITYKIKSWEDLCKGAYGILEPNPKKCERISPKELDIVVVPGSVFDRRGARYGYGGGFYDRFLAYCAPQAIRIALAFSIQVQDYILIQPHDQLMDLIVTEDEIIRVVSVPQERLIL